MYLIGITFLLPLFAFDIFQYDYFKRTSFFLDEFFNFFFFIIYENRLFLQTRFLNEYNANQLEIISILELNFKLSVSIFNIYLFYRINHFFNWINLNSKSITNLSRKLLAKGIVKRNKYIIIFFILFLLKCI